MIKLILFRLIVNGWTFKSLKLKVDIYYNFRKKCLSIRYRGVVIGYAYFVTLKDVKLIVSQAGRERALKKKRKNVHAFARGVLVALDDDFQPSPGLSCATYNYTEVDSFVTDRGTSKQTPVYSTDACTVTIRGVWFEPQLVNESAAIANNLDLESEQTPTPVYVTDSRTVTKATKGVWFKPQPQPECCAIANNLGLEDALQNVAIGRWSLVRFFPITNDLSPITKLQLVIAHWLLLISLPNLPSSDLALMFRNKRLQPIALSRDLINDRRGRRRGIGANEEVLIFISKHLPEKLLLFFININAP